LAISSRWGKYPLRSTIASSNLSDDSISAATFGTSWTISNGLTNAVDINYTPSGTRIQDTLSYRSDYGSFGLGLNFSDNNTIGVSLSFTSGLEFAEKDHKPKLGSSKSGATIKLNYFLDEDGDGVRSENEELFSDLGFTGVPTEVTDEGTIVLTEVRAQSFYILKAGSVFSNDPFVLLDKKDRIFAIHPGSVGTYDIPLTMTSAVEGFVLKKKGTGRERPVKNAKVYLTNTATKAVIETKTQFDGFFELDSVPLGHYHIVIKTRAGEKIFEQEIDVDTWGDYLTIPDIILTDEGGAP